MLIMDKLEIAKELLKNTTNIYLKDYIENYIANMNGYIATHVDEEDYGDQLVRLDLCISYIEKEKFDIRGWQLFEIPIEYAHVFYNHNTLQMFDLAAFEDGKVIPRYILAGNEEDAKSIQEAIEKYVLDKIDNRKVFASLLKELRKSKNMTQGQLADALGISQNQISKYEKGRDIPTVQNLRILCQYFNVSMDFLLMHE